MRATGLVLAVAMVVVAACGRRHEAPASNPLEALRTRLPSALAGWLSEPAADQLWDGESIYEYIDGHAEVYLAYGMTGCLTRSYSGPAGQGPVVVDVFRLASSADAWGVFRHDADGERAEVGQAARLRPGWLTAWQGPYAISVTADGEGVPDQVLVDLGRAAADAAAESGPPPRIVTELPAAGLVVDSVRFVHHPLLLNAHLFISSEDLLGLGDGAEAALGRYLRDQATSWLVMVDSRDEGRAAAAVAAMLAAYLPEAVEGEPVMTEDGTWSAVARRGSRIAVVVEASSAELAQALMDEVVGGGGR